MTKREVERLRIEAKQAVVNYQLAKRLAQAKDGSLGARVAELRMGMGMSVQDLAELLGQTKVSVYNLEANRCWPQRHNVFALAEIFGLTAAQLFEGVKS